MGESHSTIRRGRRSIKRKVIPKGGVSLFGGVDVSQQVLDQKADRHAKYSKKCDNLRESEEDSLPDPYKTHSPSSKDNQQRKKEEEEKHRRLQEEEENRRKYSEEKRKKEADDLLETEQLKLKQKQEEKLKQLKLKEEEEKRLLAEREKSTRR